MSHGLSLQDYTFKRIPTEYSYQWAIFLEDDKVGSLYMYEGEVLGLIKSPNFGWGEDYHPNMRRWTQTKKQMKEHIYDLVLEEEIFGRRRSVTDRN